MDVEAKRKIFIDNKLAIIESVRINGIQLTKDIGGDTAAEERELDATALTFATAQLPRDRAKLEETWVEFQNQCYYYGWKFAHTFCQL